MEHPCTPAEHHPSEPGRWPRYLGALALDAWLKRVAAYETSDEPPSAELFIAQYHDEETAPCLDEAFQLPLHLQWGREPVVDDPHSRPLRPDDAMVLQRVLTTSVDVLAHRKTLFALYGQLEPRTYAGLETRLRMGTGLPCHARLHSIHGQYPAKGVIEACGIASYGGTAQALVTRLERKHRRWLGTVLRIV
jgi:hypothetical protein